MKESLIPLGRFFFKWRNILFPVIVIGLFALRPPAQTLFASRQLEATLEGLAICLIALGVFVRMLVIGFIAVARNGRNKTAHADALFTKGMFGVSRNSLYLGNIIIYFGVFMLHGNAVVVLAGTSIFLFIYYAIIFSEEAFLARTFNDSFAAYCQNVPRLFPKFTNWKEATKGMNFSWKRALYLEYNIIGQAVLMVALALWYKNYNATGGGMPTIAVSVLLLGDAIFLLTIRTLKRR